MKYYAPFLVLILTFTQAGYTKILECVNQNFNFGQVAEGKILTHDFTIKNVSRKPVKITKVFASCGCISTVKGEHIIKQNQSFEVPVEFNTSGYGGKNTEKEIYIFINHQNKPTLTLTLSASVKGFATNERLSFVPKQVPIVNSDKMKHTISVFVPSDKNIQLRISGPDWLKFNLKKIGNHKSLKLTKWSIELQLKQVLNKCKRDYIVLHSNLTGFEKSNIPVKIIPARVISVSPPVLFPKKNDGKFLSAHFSIQLFHDEIKKLFNKESVKDIQIIPSSNHIRVSTIHSDYQNIKFYMSTSEKLGGTKHLFVFLGNSCVGKIPVIFF